MNFSKITKAVPRRTWLGKLIRLPLDVIPTGTVVPILQGRLRGKRWVVGSSLHTCWLGGYEWETQRVFGQIVKPGDTVFDVGAHVGFYALLASVLVGPAGRVFAFEPLPENIAYLKRHIALNRLENVAVIEAAVSNHSGAASFKRGEGGVRGTGRLSAIDGDIQVNVIRLDDLVASGQASPPGVIKIDVEGAGFGVLDGARTLLARARPVIFWETHNPEERQAAWDLLVPLGYELDIIEHDRPAEGVDEVLARPR